MKNHMVMVKKFLNDDVLGQVSPEDGDKDVLVCYTPSAPGLMVPSAGYNMVWTGVSSGLGTGAAVSRYRIEERKADRIEIEAAFDFKIVSSALGYFLSNCTS